MLAFLAILFILAVTLLIGMRVGRSVPDEVQRWRRLFPAYADAFLLVAIMYAFLRFGALWLAFLVPAALIVARHFFPFTHAHGPVSGIVLAAATMLPPADLAVVAVLLLAMNFLLGIGAKMRMLVRTAALQWCAALLFLLALHLL